MRQRTLAETPPGLAALLLAASLTCASGWAQPACGDVDGNGLVAVQDALGIPVRFVGTGEGPDDLAPFSAEAFVEALFR